MGKRGKNQKKGPQYSKKTNLRHEDAEFNNGDDEIDAFHKKRDIIPLDINADDVDSDEDDDDEQPIFNYEGIDGDDDDEEDDDEEDDDEDDHDDDEYDDSNLKGLAAKIVRQQKYLKEKMGDFEDEVDSDAEEDEKKQKVWSRGKNVYYGDDGLQSSDGDTPAEEEEEVIKLQKERAESLRAEDFGLQSDEQDDSDEEPTLGDIMVKGRPDSKTLSHKESEVVAVPTYEEVKKDLSALSREEQMEVVYSSAPELVGLLDELNDATKQLETHVNPLVSKVRKGENAMKEGLHYLEVKQLLLLTYCQTITFYLLLKSEGQPVRDHPVIARLVDIKILLDKMKELDRHIPDGFEDLLVEKTNIVTAKKPAAKGLVESSDLFPKLDELTGPLIEEQEPSKLRKSAKPVQMQSVEVNEKKRKLDKLQDQPVSSDSVKMLQYRAALEEKLKQKAGSIAPKTDNRKKQKLKKLTGKLETTDDFDDDAMDVEGANIDVRHTSSLSSKLSRIVPAKGKMLKGVSGDDDLPERDDLGERRWKHELRVLARAGIKSKDEEDAQLEDGPESSGGDEPEDYYNLIKRQRESKLKMKAEKYSRNLEAQYEPATTADGKRHITTQMEKNRGLTRARKKEDKNPRKKLRGKYKKAVSRRKGQVRDHRQPRVGYDGETTGINPNISRSTRL